MSGPVVHHVIAQQFLHSILEPKYTDSKSEPFWKNINDGYLSPFYFLGAQGPDFLFFNMNDWPLGGAVKTVAETYWEVLEFQKKLVEKIKKTVPPEIWQSLDTLEGLAKDAVERSAVLSEIKELITDVNKNIDAIKSLIETKIEAYITDSFDLFNMIKHPQQHGQDYKEWWWFDTLHIRRSGQFLETLLRESADFSPERAYAIGYLTHYAADTVGHPFVNIISGGPYRTHAQRHKVVENHQDVWAFSHFVGGEFSTSNLAKAFKFDGDPNRLPANLCKFIISCIRSTYYNAGNNLYGRNITVDDLNLAYQAWFLWFTGVSNDLGLPLPKPFSMTAEMAEIWTKFVNSLGDIEDYIGRSSSGGGGILGFLKKLAAIVVGPILLASALTDFILGEIMALGAAPIRASLSVCYQWLYDSFNNFRKSLVMNGFAFPRVCGLNDPFTRHMLHSKYPDIFIHDAFSLPKVKGYPSSKFSMPGLVSESHLVYPWPTAANCETDACIGAPESYFSADTAWYINDSYLNFNKNLYEYFRKFVECDPAGTSPAVINSNFAEFADKASEGGLGSAVAFCEALYEEFLAYGKDTAFIDFSLDSDRGYAYKSWRKVKDMELLNRPIMDYEVTNIPIETDRSVPNVHTDILYPDRSLL